MTHHNLQKKFKKSHMTTLYDVTNSFPAQKTSENVMFITIMLIYINHELSQINILSEFKKWWCQVLQNTQFTKKFKKVIWRLYMTSPTHFLLKKPLKILYSLVSDSWKFNQNKKNFIFFQIFFEVSTKIKIGLIENVHFWRIQLIKTEFRNSILSFIIKY